MINKNITRALLATIGLLGVSSAAHAQAGRDYIYIVGSSTVYPFATVVAERFGRNSSYKTPKVESTGSGGGLKLFCDGVGVDYPDVSNASRPIKVSELEACEQNGVRGIIEVKIGYDGIVIANGVDAPPLNISRHQLYLALAKQVPGSQGVGLIDNPYQLWSDIDPDLPRKKIEVLGPPPTSGTRDVLVELVLERGCMSVAWIARLRDKDPGRFRALCHMVREDGAYVDAGENDNLIVLKLEANPDAIGIFGFNFLDQNKDRVKGSLVDGIAPTFEAIADGVYPLSRPLYFYVKKSHVHVIPGLRAFLGELTSQRAWGDEGYLADRGLIPLSQAERGVVARAVRELTTLSLASK